MEVVSPGAMLLIREFETSTSANTVPRPTGYFKIVFTRTSKRDEMRELQKGNPRHLEVAKKYEERNALNTHKAAKEAMRSREVEGKEGWFFLQPGGSETWSMVEEQITRAIQDYNDE